MSEYRPHVVERTDGYHQVIIQGIPHHRNIPHKERWGVQDVAEISQQMAKSMAGPRSLIHATKIDHHFQQRNTNPENDPRIRFLASVMSGSWQTHNSRSILVDDAFAQMMLAAAISAPDEPIRSEDLISKNATLYLETPVNIHKLFMLGAYASDDPQDHMNRVSEMFENVEIRAIHWGYFGDEDLMITLHIDESTFHDYEMLHTTREESIKRPLDPDFMNQYLATVSFGIGDIDGDGASHDTQHASVKHLVRLVRAFKAVLDSQLSQEHTAEEILDSQPRKARKKRSKRKEPTDVSNISVVSLIDRRHGRYELEAATGIKVRSHWVRGHWRKQWYPSMQDHRTIWIDGFIKGDPSLGHSTNTTVYTTHPHT